MATNRGCRWAIKVAFTAKVCDKPKKYIKGANTVPITPTTTTLPKSLPSNLMCSLVAKRYANAVNVAKNTSDAVTWTNENDENNILPRTASTAHIAPAPTPNRIPRIFWLTISRSTAHIDCCVSDKDLCLIMFALRPLMCSGRYWRFLWWAADYQMATSVDFILQNRFWQLSALSMIRPLRMRLFQVWRRRHHMLSFYILSKNWDLLWTLLQPERTFSQQRRQ